MIFVFLFFLVEQCLSYFSKNRFCVHPKLPTREIALFTSRQVVNLHFLMVLILCQVLMAAGDTFRAAASDQLEIWAERTGCEIVVAEGEKAKASSGGQLTLMK